MGIWGVVGFGLVTGSLVCFSGCSEPQPPSRPETVAGEEGAPSKVTPPGMPSGKGMGMPGSPDDPEVIKAAGGIEKSHIAIDPSTGKPFGEESEGASGKAGLKNQ